MAAMHRSLVFGLLLTAALARTTAAQQPQATPPRGWTFGVTADGTLWTDDDAAFDALWGPALQIGLVRPRGIGFDFRAGYFLPTGFYNLDGATGILGANYSLPLGAHVVQFKLGAAGMVGGDSDGSIIGGGGPYGGVGVVLRVAGRLGVQADALARYYATGEGGVFAPSAALGLTLLPK
jgi:hypothetical protein